MSTNAPTDEKSTVLPRSDAQIVHGVCHDCPDYEELYQEDSAADAIQAAIEDAIQHARVTGHENVDHELLTDPDLDFCEDCDEPVHVRVDAGPAAEAKQLCGCVPTGGMER